MTIYAGLIGVCWVVFILVWGVMAFTAKRTVRRTWWRGVWIRIAALIGILLIAKSRLVTRESVQYLSGIITDPAVNAAGVVLCAAGIALAVWARVYLASNWGAPMSVKENPELVTTGPYAYIRNPIYSGMLLAILGSACINLWWVVILLFAGAYFIYSALTEERIMLKAFPDTYPAYKARTKMLIPFVF